MQTQADAVEIAGSEFSVFEKVLSALIEQDLAQLEANLDAAGAPRTPGRKL